ncbi:gliding motility-associated C-terminal domain-containing protein [Flavobacterium sp. 245]|uniref:T9SS type B sorting domain-containing protein n=1 Tax=Flavobacterium sp. 245 TaxID=2512115 RepID=UPI00105DF043|nr:gliding motility-associated C-terminal domain-containing protein [Flavobacterium sp. 245]TDO96161.1 putative repeat protein (TIGR01451 family) [Flavobacterium sp. 245]
MGILSKSEQKSSWFSVITKNFIIELIHSKVFVFYKRINKSLHLKFGFSFIFLFLFNTVHAQLYGSFPYSESFTSGVKPPEISLLATQNGVNSTTFVSNGMQLTPAVGRQFGAVYINNKKFSSINGIEIEFEFGMYGGSGADGISMFLFDAAISDPVIGAGGGSLGYGFARANNKTISMRQTGLTGAYLGVGFDSYGVFKRQVFIENERFTGVPTDKFTSSTSQVTLRGARGEAINQSIGLGDGFTGYPVLKTQGTLSGSVGGAELDSSTGNYVYSPGLAASFNLRTTTFTTDPNNPNYRKAFVSLMPHPSGGYNITVKIQHGLIITTVINNYWYKTSITYKENANPAVTDFNTDNIKGPDTVHTLSSVVPDNFRIGFAGSTGLLNDVHLIRNLIVRLPFSALVTDDTFIYCNNNKQVIYPLVNDMAYSGAVSSSPTGISSNIDLESFQFLDAKGTFQGHNYFIEGQGTWAYNAGDGGVTFTPNVGYTGISTINYSVKGLSSPYNDEAYRSLPGKITANQFLPSSISSQPLNQTVNPQANTAFATVATGGNGIINYQWQVSTDKGINWSNINNGAIYSDVTTNKLSLRNIPTSLNGYLYRVLINNVCQNIVSNSALLNVKATDLSVEKNVSNLSPFINSNVTFTIKVTNNGPSSATGVTVNDLLPSGYTFVNAIASSGDWSSPNWSIGELANGSSATLTIVAKVNSTGSYANTALITGNERDEVLSNNSSTITLIPVPVNNIAALPDTNTAPVNGASGGIAGINILENDTLNGNPLNPLEVVITSIPTGPLTVGTDGTVSVAPNTPEGIYTVDYTICEVLNPTNCATATVTINVICAFNVICPTFPDTTVECYEELPANNILTISQFKLLGNRDGLVSDTPCGVVEVIATNGPNKGCNSEVMRSYLIVEYSDENNNNIRDLGEDLVLNQFLCYQNILIKDVTAPIFVETLPANFLTVECNAIPSAAVLTATDNCGIAEVSFSELNIAGACLGSYTLKRNWIATDLCGLTTNYVQTIVVQDKTPPVLITAFDSVVVADCDKIPDVPALKFTDNCSDSSSIILNFNEVKSAILVDGTYTIVRTWTAIDNCGNQTSTSQTVNVKIPNYLKTKSINAQCNIDPNLKINILNIIKNEFSDVFLEGGTFSDVSMSGGLETLTGIFTPLNLADNEYIVRYENNDSYCPRVVEVKIPVNTRPGCTEDNCVKINFHNAISPNGDGLNDEFIIDNVTNDCYKSNSVEIYNRWGVKVFDTANYDNSTKLFKGLSEGRQTIKQSATLSTGTYYYIFKYINIEGNISAKTGWLYLSGN